MSSLSDRSQPACQLVRLDTSPVIALNRAIAIAELDGPDVTLAAVDRLEEKLAGYHAYLATRYDQLALTYRGGTDLRAITRCLQL